MRTLRYDLPFCSSATLMTQLSRKQHAANWRGVFVDYICRYMDSVLKKIIQKFVLISIGLTSPHSCWFNKLTLFILETVFLSRPIWKLFYCKSFSPSTSITVLVMPCTLEKRHRCILVSSSTYLVRNYQKSRGGQLGYWGLENCYWKNTWKTLEG